MFSEEKLEELRAKYGKIGIVDFSGHQVVFRKPSREQARDYRRKIATESEKPDAVDQLAQLTIVGFDGEEDVTKARIAFTGVFLEEFPLAMSNVKFITVISVLAGLVEEELDRDLGKGARIKGPPRAPSPKD